MSKPKKISALGKRTQLAVLGRDTDGQHGFINPPVYHGSTVLFPTASDLLNRKNYSGFRDKGHQPYSYGLRGTPTTDALEEVLTELDGGEGTVLLPSGLAAVTLSLLTVAGAGDHVLMTDSVYQPTRVFCAGTLKRMGVETTYYDPRIGGDIAALFRDNTTAVFTESPGSQTFEIQDINAIAKAARDRDVAVVVDNTWATPLFFRPLDHGADMTVQAGTKYFCGHSDVMMGSITANAAWWPRLRRTHDEIGMALAPDDVFLTLRGVRTMAVRLAQHQASAIEIAQWLEKRPEVSRVLHPALESHPDHHLFKRQFTGSTGLFSAVLNPIETDRFHAFLDSLTLFGMGYSWGGYESLIIPFDSAPYRTATTFQAEGPCVRLHIGLEDTADLKDDLDQAFRIMNADHG